MEPKADWYDAGPEALFQEMQRILYSRDELFYGLSDLRAFVNANFPTFEFYQEDTWNERVDGETHLESILRCLKTLHETAPFAYDAYLNHRDDRGVWHLDDYTETVLLMPDTRELAAFLFQHRPVA